MKIIIRTSVTSITLIAANCPVFVCRPYKNNYYFNYNLKF